jgi:hypothetical protein
MHEREALAKIAETLPRGVAVLERIAAALENRQAPADPMNGALAVSGDEYEKMQIEADDLYNEAHDLYLVYGSDYQRAQELELRSARLQDKVNAAIAQGKY